MIKATQDLLKKVDTPSRIKKYVINRDENIYQAWPDVTQTHSGKLVCVFSECTHHLNRSYTRIVLTTSEDFGRTWSKKQALTEGTNDRNYYYNCARISTMEDGRLAVIVDKIAMEQEEDNPETTEIILFFSDDEGQSWSAPISTPAKGIVPDKLCVLDNGRWIISCHCRINGWLTQRLWYSDDSGQSWSQPVICGQAEGLNLCEISILPIRSKPGTLVAFLRENSFMGLDCFKIISEDYGQTWSELIKFPLPGCHRPVAGYLDDGRIMITYRFLQGGKIQRGLLSQNFFGAVTDESSALAKTRNEAWARVFPIDYDPSPASDLGYSGWVQFDNGEVYVVNYIMDDMPNAQIRGYSFWPNEIFS